MKRIIKLLYILLQLCLLALSSVSFGQESRYSMLYRGMVARKYADNINGTPYWDTLSFKPGSVMFNGRLYDDVLIRINAAEGELEVKNSKDMAPICPDRHQVSWFKRNGALFVNLQYQGIGNREGFFELLSDSSPALLFSVKKILTTGNDTEHNGAHIGYFDPSYNNKSVEYFKYCPSWWLYEHGKIVKINRRKAQKLKDRLIEDGSFSASLKEWHPVDNLFMETFVPSLNKPILTQIDSLPDGYFSGTPTVVSMDYPVFAKYKNKLYEIGLQRDNMQNSDLVLSGNVVDENGNGLSDILIYIEGKEESSFKSKADGSFIAQLKTGEYRIHFSGEGMVEQCIDIVLKGSGSFTVLLHEKTTMLDEALVSGERINRHHDASLGLERLDLRDISKLPAIFGEKDLFRATLSLPGVQSVGELSAGINVRGGSSDQNLVLFNGNTIFYPSHFFGVNTVFNPDIIESVDIYKSGAIAKYGGRASSVIDINSRDGNKEKVRGGIGLGLLTSRFYLEGPLTRSKKTSFLVGMRSSYSDWILKRLPTESEFRGGSASFYDMNLGIHHKINASNSLKLYGYTSSDRFSPDSLNSYIYRNINASLHYCHNDDYLNYDMSVGYDGYATRIEQGMNSYEWLTVNTAVNQLFTRGNVNVDLNSGHTVGGGGEILYYYLRGGQRKPKGELSRITPLTIDPKQAIQPSLFVSDTWSPNDSITIEGSVKLSGSVCDDCFYLIPDMRISGRYSLDQTTTFKVEFGTVSQYLHQVTNTMVVSPVDTWLLSDSRIRPTKGWQTSAGIYHSANGAEYDLSIEAYYKRLNHYYDAMSGAELIMNKYLFDELVATRNKAYGVELSIKKNKGKLNGWISYTWSRSLLQSMSDNHVFLNQGKWYLASSDRPHDFKLVGNYDFTRRYGVSFVINYCSGHPVTIPEGFFQYIGGNRLYYSSKNNYRIPNYFRTDIAYNIGAGHSKKALLHGIVTIGCYNVTGRKNAYTVYWSGNALRGYKLSIFSMPVPYVSIKVLIK